MNPSTMSPCQLVEHIETTHHQYLNKALPHLSTLMQGVVQAHGEAHPELGDVSACLAELRADLEPHLMKEEQALFPMIRELYGTQDVPEFHCGTLRNPITVMEAEHDMAGEVLARLRSLTSAFTPPGDGDADFVELYSGLAELEADTLLHIQKENELLFPAVLAEEMHRGPR
ncbi:MAG: hypothetical protein GY745_14935 [Actinomycetia bacterium]|nr:hypothetical protein [Actinomycetes bacterium]